MVGQKGVSYYVIDSLYIVLLVKMYFGFSLTWAFVMLRLFVALDLCLGNSLYYLLLHQDEKSYGLKKCNVAAVFSLGFCRMDFGASAPTFFLP